MIDQVIRNDTATRHEPTADAGDLVFVFTDIADSTRMWVESPREMSRRLAEHDDAMGRIAQMWGGRIFKNTGDGVCAVMPDPPSAVQFAVCAAAASTQLDLPSRIAVHVGPVERRGDDYFGLTLCEIRRMVDVAPAGRIVCSEPVAAAVPATWLRPVGVRRLRGLPHPTELFWLIPRGR